AAAAVPGLTRMLEAEDQSIRIEATVALANIGPAARSATPILLKRLKSAQESGRGAAAYALGKLEAKSAVKDLKFALRDSDQRVRMASAYALTLLDVEHRGDLRDVLPVLIENLDHEMPLIRREMAEAIALLSNDASGAIPALVERVSSDKDPTVRASALHALTQIAPTDRRGLAVALTALSDDETAVRRTAAFALGRQGPLANSAVPGLRLMLRHRDRFDRAIAAWALVRILPKGDFGQEAIGLLVDAIEAENPRARVELAKVLGELGADPRSRKALEQLRKDTDPQVRAAATSALKSFK
ncbi:MAG: HEAT repeat domain-containing protein, partial [Planctomycetaceae bacterium]